LARENRTGKCQAGLLTALAAIGFVQQLKDFHGVFGMGHRLLSLPFSDNYYIAGKIFFFKVQMMVGFVNAQRNMITAAGPRAHYMAFLERKG
jgi:hypothetical protein